MSCSICLESLKSGIIKTDCNHTFHKICLDTWINFNNSCPHCRSIINKKENNRYRVRELYTGNYFEAELIETKYTDLNTICYKFTNITNNKYPMSKICYKFNKHINIIKI